MMGLVEIKNSIEKYISKIKMESMFDVGLDRGLKDALSLINTEIEDQANWVRDHFDEDYDLSSLTNDQLCGMYEGALDVDMALLAIEGELDLLNVPRKETE
jgi:hypothetical protein